MFNLRFGRLSLFILLLGAALFASAPASADCDEPVAPAGRTIYNVDFKTFQYCDGTDWIAMHGAPESTGPSGCDNIGDQCSGGEYDGLYYIGSVGGNDVYAASSDESGTYAWGGYGENDNADSTTDGLTNTDNLVGDGHGHPAAQACRDRGAEWYLPAEDELNLMWVMVDTHGVTAGLNTGGAYYWSSTEYDTFNAWVQVFINGYQYNDSKNVAYRVRCVRRASSGSSACDNPAHPEGTIIYNDDENVMQGCAAGQWHAFGPPGSGATGPSGCDNIGDQCSGGDYDGLYYIGSVGGNDIYAAASDESGTYEYGGYGTDLNGDNSSVAPELDDDGLANTNWLLTSGEGDHEAAQACRDKGADWYLPARDELNLMWEMVDTHGVSAGLNTGGGLYWSSTEHDDGYAWIQRFSDGNQASTHKLSSFLVRCVRRGPGGGSGCASPDGTEGALMYNTNHSVMQYCDGSNWMAIGKQL